MDAIVGISCSSTSVSHIAGVRWTLVVFLPEVFCDEEEFPDYEDEVIH
jgi:hypothetical protein